MTFTVQDAVDLANSAHRDQRDKAGQPYILHPLRVGAALYRFGDDAVIAGILHDVVEDTAVTMKDLLDLGVSGRALTAIDAVTIRPGEHRSEYIPRALEHPIGRWVKASDVLDNARRIAWLVDSATKARLAERYLETALTIRTVIPGFPIGNDLLHGSSTVFSPPLDWTT